MKSVAGEIKEMFVECGYEIEYMRVNDSERKIEGKVVDGSGTLYVHVSPDVIKVWDGVLSNEKERGAFAWGMREAWLNPTAMRPGNIVKDLPEGSEDNVRLTIAEKPVHYQGGFYVVKGLMIGVSLLAANGMLGII